MLIIFLIFALITGLALWIRKLVLKSRLEKGLGRKVKDSELLSFNAWMDASSEENKR